MRWPFITTCRVPPSLEAVTSIRRDTEVDPRSVGVDPAGVERIWRAVRAFYQVGVHPAIQVCIRRRGQVILDRAIGYASGNGPDDAPDAPKVLVTPETPFNIFSASKAVTAMLVHLLDQRNLIRLDDPVCEYIPEFGVHRKQWITIRHVLAHRAGIPNLPPEVMRLENLADREGIVRVICEAQPTSRPGRELAYHAITGGFILGEVVRRVTGQDIQTFLDAAIRRPLGFRWTRYGVPRRDVRRVAVNYFTGPPPLPPFSTMLNRTLGVEFRQVVEMSNDARFLTGVMPSGNIVTTADELSRFYQLLLNGGELGGAEIFEPRTIRRATSEQSYLEFDAMLGLPVRYSLGFMLGGKWFSFYGPDTQYAFGHLGLTNIVAWADQERQVAVTLMTSGKPLIYTGIYYAYQIMREIGVVCPKEPPPRRAARVPRKRARKPRRVASAS